MKKFCTIADTDPNLKALNGVRVLSACYVILGHSFSWAFNYPMENPMAMLTLVSDFFMAIIPGGFYAVDVFFFLSGFLASYLMTIRLYPRKGKDNYLMLYFHRFYRLIPAITAVTFIGLYLFPYFGSGPMWPLILP